VVSSCGHDSGQIEQLVAQLSLSRLNHRLPRSQPYPEVVQGTAEFHDQIADAFFPQADAVFDDATTLDTAVDMLDPQPMLVERLVRPLLLPRELLAAGFLRRHEDLDLGQCEGQEAQILQEPTPGGHRIWGGLSNPLVMEAAAVGVAQKEDEEQGVAEEHILALQEQRADFLR
jgi:hypothetical protein